ncbi:MAPEG family protein [Marinicellulosiphila megalodicopiae]|uniref:MAPEG family protein n=1 Tax=Marinicellulosiphila megalodicopiae TaxID=2724896 RepID=UPI003BAFB517
MYQEYFLTFVALIVIAFIFLLNVFIFDATSIIKKQQPGFPIEPNHESFLFRSHRALSNLNETLSLFLILAFVGILMQVNSNWLGFSALVYSISRFLYVVCYLFNIKLMRSMCFGIGLLALCCMFVVNVFYLI